MVKHGSSEPPHSLACRQRCVPVTCNSLFVLQQERVYNCAEVASLLRRGVILFVQLLVSGRKSRQVRLRSRQPFPRRVPSMLETLRMNSRLNGPNEHRRTAATEVRRVIPVSPLHARPHSFTPSDSPAADPYSDRPEDPPQTLSPIQGYVRVRLMLRRGRSIT